MNVKWLSCNECKEIVVWVGVKVLLLRQRFEANTCICHALLPVVFWICKSGIYMCLLNSWLNLCTGFWLMEKTEKELKVQTMLDEITSASLTSLWLHWSTTSAAWCHWIIIKQLWWERRNSFTPFTARYYFARKSRLLLKAEFRPSFEKDFYFKAYRVMFSFLWETDSWEIAFIIAFLPSWQVLGCWS